MNFDIDAIKALAISAGKVGAPFIEQAISVLASAETGPIGPMVLNNVIFPMINNALGLSSDTPPDVTAAAIESNPDTAGVALQTLSEDHAFQLATQKNDQDFQIAAQAQQVSINTVEAQNPSWFIGGWRPMIGWSLGGVLMLSATLPFIVWGFLACFGISLPVAPEMSTQAYYILGAILGVTVAARSFDKVQGTSPKQLGGKSITTVHTVSR